MVKYLPIDSEVWERVDKRSGIHRKFHQACHAGESGGLKGPDDRCFVSCVNRAIRVFGERVAPNYCEQRNISRTCINMYVSIIFVKCYDII